MNDAHSYFQSRSQISQDLLLKPLPQSQELWVLYIVDGLEVGQLVGPKAFLLELRKGE